MDKQTKSHYLLRGMLAEFQMKPQARLLNKMVGIKFKEIRLENNLTAEKVVDKNKRYFSSIYDIYKFIVEIYSNFPRRGAFGAAK